MYQEKGNALFIILIAIGLLGVATAMFTRSSSTTEETGDYEQRQIEINKILRTAATLEAATQNLILRGCSESVLSFWADSDGDGIEDSADDYYNDNAPDDRSCHLFNPAGAGLEYEPGWIFSGANRILGIDDDNRTELLAVFQTTQANCLAINNSIGAPNNGSDAYSEDITLTLFTGTYGTNTADAFTIGETSAALADLDKSCLKVGANYYFVATLQPR